MSPPDPDASGLFVFVRFHARAGHENAVEALIREVVAASRAEPGNLSIHAFRSVRDDREFYIHSRWRDEAAFDTHAGLAHTRRFLESVGPQLDHEVRPSRTSLWL